MIYEQKARICKKFAVAGKLAYHNPNGGIYEDPNIRLRIQDQHQPLMPVYHVFVFFSLVHLQCLVDGTDEYLQLLDVASNT
ncbi:hypothetical protein RJ641_029444, partial [Dillenia turbinata]